jgi:hypothetical protein
MGCHYCGRDEDHTLNERGKMTVELRPYGPGGAPICFECATATPEREAQADAAFGALLSANEAVSPVGVAMIGASDGPVPFDPEMVEERDGRLVLKERGGERGETSIR